MSERKAVTISGKYSPKVQVVFRKNTVLINETGSCSFLSTDEMKTLINEFYKYHKEISNDRN